MQLGWVWSHEMSEFSERTWWNIALSIYNKSKDMFTNMDDKKITGIDPIRNFIVARKMFDALEAAVIEDAVRHKRDIYIFTHWVDNRRRDAYYRVLSKKGYRYGTAPWATKVIMKKFRWKDYEEQI